MGTLSEVGKFSDLMLWVLNLGRLPFGLCLFSGFFWCSD